MVFVQAFCLRAARATVPHQADRDEKMEAFLGMLTIIQQVN
jgi:hypothetical protein